MKKIKSLEANQASIKVSDRRGPIAMTAVSHNSQNHATPSRIRESSGPDGFAAPPPYFGTFRYADLKECRVCRSWLEMECFDPRLVLDSSDMVSGFMFADCRFCRAFPDAAFDRSLDDEVIELGGLPA